MSIETDREASSLDPNFVETIEILNQNNVPYWICHGTLLGLIRDKRLIPWDHDIDIALWAGSFSKSTLIELMTSKGFFLKSDGSDYDFISFYKEGGREVDFNYYRSLDGSDVAFSEWFISRSRLTTALELIATKKPYSGKFDWLIKSLYFSGPIAKIIIRFLKKAGLFYKSAGYTTPNILLNQFSFIEIDGVKIRCPVSYNEVLKFVYGENWKIPKRQYDWTKESPSTRISNSRFN